jgi:hypothetical protein
VILAKKQSRGLFCGKHGIHDLWTTRTW